MTEFLFEGGPLDGRRMETSGAHVVRIPRPLPWNAPDMGLNYSIWEYRRSGSVYRFETLIGDASAEIVISAEAFREPVVRREGRRMLRASLVRLAAGKEVDRIVWALGRDPRTCMYTLAALVGGRRVEFAEHRRQQLRAGAFR